METNLSLQQQKAANVTDYAKFQNAGYLGMYNMESWKLEKETWNSLGRKMPPALALAPKDVLPLR